MSVGDLFRRKRREFVRGQIVGYAKDEYEQALEGKDGPAMQTAAEYVKTHKTEIGAVCGFLAGLCTTLNMSHPGQNFDIAAEVLSYTSTAMLAGGIMKSDQTHKDARAMKIAGEDT